jgi:hypothetical protein
LAYCDDATDARRARRSNQVTGSNQFNAFQVTKASPPLAALKVNDGMYAGCRPKQDFFVQQIANHNFGRILPGKVLGFALREKAAYPVSIGRQSLYQMTANKTRSTRD